MPQIQPDARANSTEGLILREWEWLRSQIGVSTTSGNRNYAYVKIRVSTGYLSTGSSSHAVADQAANDMYYVWVESDRDLQVSRSDAHSEPLLAEVLVGIRRSGVTYQVQYLFTERQPCSSCETVVGRITVEERVYWVAPYESATSIRLNAKDTVAALRKS